MLNKRPFLRTCCNPRHVLSTLAFLGAEDMAALGRPTAPVCRGLSGFPGHGTFSAKTRTVRGKPYTRSSSVETLSPPNTSGTAAPAQGLPMLGFPEERKSMRSSPEHRTESPNGTNSPERTRKMGPWRLHSQPRPRGCGNGALGQLLVSKCPASL